MPVLNLFSPTSTETVLKEDSSVSELEEIVDSVFSNPEVQEKLKKIEAGEGGSLAHNDLWIFGIAPCIGSHPMVKFTLQSLLDIAHLRHNVQAEMPGWEGSVTSDYLAQVRLLVGGEFSDFSVEIAENFVGVSYFVFKYLDSDLFGDSV